jgi:predicted GTPase
MKNQMSSKSQEKDPRKANETTLEQVGGIAVRLESIANELGRDKDYQAIAPTLNQNTLGIFKLVVLGEIKKGKSSLINALLGEESPIVPVAREVSTSTVFKIIYGSEKTITVFFQPDLETGMEKPPLQISGEEIVNYGTENGNPDNIKGVDFIGIEIPNPMLSSGLVIIDTPGLGGLVKSHRDITWRYLPNADAVCFVTDSVSEVINQHEIAFLKELVTRITRRLFFVQTKTDAADDVKVVAWRERNIEILREQLGLQEKQIRYFCVSTVLKEASRENKDMELAAMSGYPQLRQFLEDGLLRLKDKELARRCASLLIPVINALKGELDNRLAIIAADGEGKTQGLKGEFERTKKDLIQLRTEEIPRLKSASQEGLGRLRTKLDDQFCEALESTINAYQRKLEAKSAEELLKDAEILGPALVADVNALMIRQSKAAVNEIDQFFEDLLGAAAASGENTNSGKSIAKDTANISLAAIQTDKLFAALGGASAAGGAVLLVAKFALFAVNPILGVAAALTGGWLMLKRTEKKKSEELLQKIKSAGREVQSKARDLWQRELRTMMENAHHSVQNILESLIASKQSALEENIKQLEERRNKTFGEVREQKETYDTLKREVSSYQARLSQFA